MPDMEMSLLESLIVSGRVDAELVLPGVPTPTVPSAAEALGVSEAQILKSLLFVAPDGQVVLAVACGTTRVDRTALASVVGVERLKLAPPELVLERTGYQAGGTPPVGHVTAVDVVVDTRVMELSTGYGGGGKVDALLRITPAEIVRHTQAKIADITMST